MYIDSKARIFRCSRNRDSSLGIQRHYWMTAQTAFLIQNVINKNRQTAKRTSATVTHTNFTNPSSNMYHTHHPRTTHTPLHTTTPLQVTSYPLTTPTVTSGPPSSPISLKSFKFHSALTHRSHAHFVNANTSSSPRSSRT